MTQSLVDWMLPKEHGAYGQVAFPLVTALAVSGVSTAAVLLGLAIVAVFLAHEPLVVLLGHRGQRSRREQAAVARTWLANLAAGGICAAAIAAFLLPASERWTLLVPVVPAIPAAAAVFAGREKTSVAEVAVCLAFAGAAFPVAVAASAPMAVAATIAIVFAVNFALATLAVRALILKVRAGGRPSAVTLMRRAVYAAAAGVVIVITIACLGGVLPWPALLAACPGVLVSAFLAMRPPPPSRLRMVGWSLVLTSTVTAGVLVGGLRMLPRM